MRTTTAPSRARTLLAAPLAAVALLVAACGADAAEAEEPASTSDAPATVVVEHAQGETEVPTNPEVVVTFDLGSLDTLDTLGVEVTGVPDAVFPDYLAEYAGDEYPKVGSLFEPDYEAVAALEPDLIIVANRSSEVLPQLAEIAPTIDLTLDWTDYVTTFTTNATVLGEVFGRQDAVAEALAGIDERMAAVQEVAADAGTGLVLNVTGGEITAYGPGSRYGWLFDELGVVPVLEDVEATTHGDPISFEFLLEHDPNWLFVVDRDSATGESSASAQEVLDNELVAQTTAATSDQVVYLSPGEWYIVMSGLTAVDTMVGEVETALTGASA